MCRLADTRTQSDSATHDQAAGRVSCVRVLCVQRLHVGGQARDTSTMAAATVIVMLLYKAAYYKASTVNVHVQRVWTSGERVL